MENPITIPVAWAVAAALLLIILIGVIVYLLKRNDELYELKEDMLKENIDMMDELLSLREAYETSKFNLQEIADYWREMYYKGRPNEKA